jgi:deoxyribonuclease IV
MYIGAHMSVSGGLHKAIERIKKINGTALQIFSRNQRQWQAMPISDDEACQFRDAWQQWGKFPIATHASYLINLASPKPETRKKSVQALAAELVRSDKLHIPHIVMHPGSHGGDGTEVGITRIAENIDTALRQEEYAHSCIILLETTAGQGTGIGSNFEELAAIIHASKFPERLGICLDTCHIFAAGYDIRTPATFRQTFNDFEKHIGLSHLHFMHINDSKKPFGSQVDRHEHIGKGEIGQNAFRLLMNDNRLTDIPKTLETPKGIELKEDIENLALLMGLKSSKEDLR